MNYNINQVRNRELNISALEDYIEELHEEQYKTNQMLIVYKKFVKNIRDNYDCDRDAHKYNTPCRCCEADKILQGIL